MRKMEENPKKGKNEKELGLVVSQQTVIRNQAKTQQRNEKELGRTDGKFEISRSKSPYPQILVPNGPLLLHFWSHQSFIFFNVFLGFKLIVCASRHPPRHLEAGGLEAGGLEVLRLRGWLFANCLIRPGVILVCLGGCWVVLGILVSMSGAS